MRFRRKLLLGSAGAVVIGAVAAYALAPFALPLLRSTAHFRPHPDESRILVEPGAESTARGLAAVLPMSIRAVEREHGRPFSQAVHVHVCATIESFAAYGAGKGIGSAGGFVYNGRLFISPKPENTPERLPRILAHELSHLHLEQQLGTLRCAFRIPTWFKEGLAVVVSDGGGAEQASEAEAWQLIARGIHLEPTTRGHPFPRHPRRYGLTQHQFYRQSGMFVAFLKAKDPALLSALLRRLETDRSFARACQEVYGSNVQELWREFVAQWAP